MHVDYVTNYLEAYCTYTFISTLLSSLYLPCRCLPYVSSGSPDLYTFVYLVWNVGDCLGQLLVGFWEKEISKFKFYTGNDHSKEGKLVKQIVSWQYKCDLHSKLRTFPMKLVLACYKIYDKGCGNFLVASCWIIFCYVSFMPHICLQIIHICMSINALGYLERS